MPLSRRVAPYRKAIAALIGVTILIGARYLGQPLPGLDVLVMDLIRDCLLGLGTAGAVYQVTNEQAD